MAQIKQIGPGRKTTGTIDGITYVTRNGVTYARSAPTMPASAYNTPAAKKRQAIFKLIQMHLKYHLRTIRQTFTPKGNGSPSNRYFSINYKSLAAALDALADQYCSGEDVTIAEVEAAISAYAAEHPQSITIGHLSGYRDVYLTGNWPATITLNAMSGDNTVIIIVSENGITTTYNADGTVVVSGAGNVNENQNENQNQNQNDNENQNQNGSETPVTVATPTISGTTPFEETTTVTISGPADASIYYTTDGSTPTASSSLYSEALTVSETTTVKAIAIKDGVSSSVSSRTFTKGSGGGDGDGPVED